MARAQAAWNVACAYSLSRDVWLVVRRDDHPAPGGAPDQTSPRRAGRRGRSVKYICTTIRFRPASPSCARTLTSMCVVLGPHRRDGRARVRASRGQGDVEAARRRSYTSGGASSTYRSELAATVIGGTPLVTGARRASPIGAVQGFASEDLHWKTPMRHVLV
ncbi:hypothetical protein HPB50_020361 [Hyalomma asiaticum]|uniref:Uncharacterized protein n=1 Tax=Hyalomma asiaticum TaxID=266040 RepID=A0ACB7SU30_HYAAI|nr:hypothetical protein HPB50_020361 [Hyalomma asiaticum]